MVRTLMEQVLLLRVDIQETCSSHSNLYFKEGLGTIQAQGYYQNQDGQTHDPTYTGSLIYGCNIVSGCVAFYDTIYTNNWTQPFSSGTLNWPIEWKYGFNENDSIQNYVWFTYGVHYGEADGQGAATVTKAGSGPFSKKVSELTSGATSLDPCLYPVVNP